MTKERIDDGNKIIAEWMGLKPRWVEYPDKALNRFEVVKWNRWIPMEYHTSWDWLMPVYKKLSAELKKMSKKIQSDKKCSLASKNSRLKHIDDCDAIIRCHIWGVRIEDTWNGIVETIKLYDGLFIKKTKAK